MAKKLKNSRDLKVASKSTALQGKKIALAVGGGIGATEVVKIAREIRRHGAQVKPFLSPEALRFITPLSVEWASLEKPVLEAGPQVEYLEIFDAVLVCPTTLHTLSKAALGLSQTVVDLLLANQIGAKEPVCMVLTMNEQLWHHPVALEHQKRLESWGVKFYPAKAEEDRLKVPDSEVLVKWLKNQID